MASEYDKDDGIYELPDDTRKALVPPPLSANRMPPIMAESEVKTATKKAKAPAVAKTGFGGGGGGGAKKAKAKRKRK